MHLNIVINVQFENENSNKSTLSFSTETCKCGNYKDKVMEVKHIQDL